MVELEGYNIIANLILNTSDSLDLSDEGENHCHDREAFRD